MYSKSNNILIVNNRYFKDLKRDKSYLYVIIIIDLLQSKNVLIMFFKLYCIV